MMEFSIGEAMIIFIVGGGISFVGSWAGTRVTLKYMQRDIVRAQSMADSAHDRLNTLLHYKIGGHRHYDPQFTPPKIDA